MPSSNQVPDGYYVAWDGSAVPVGCAPATPDLGARCSKCGTPMHGQPGPDLLCTEHMVQHFEEEIEKTKLEIGLKEARTVLPGWDRRLNGPR